MRERERASEWACRSMLDLGFLTALAGFCSLFYLAERTQSESEMQRNTCCALFTLWLWTTLYSSMQALDLCALSPLSCKLSRQGCHANLLRQLCIIALPSPPRSSLKYSVILPLLTCAKARLIAAITAVVVVVAEFT